MFDQPWCPLFWDGKSNCIVALAPTKEAVEDPAPSSASSSSSAPSLPSASESGSSRAASGDDIVVRKHEPIEKYIVSKLCDKGGSKKFNLAAKKKKKVPKKMPKAAVKALKVKKS